MKVKTDLDILEEHIFEILEGWRTEMNNATVPTPIGDINNLIIEEVEKLLFKISKAENK